MRTRDHLQQQQTEHNSNNFFVVFILIQLSTSSFLLVSKTINTYHCRHQPHLSIAISSSSSSLTA
eukprot:m.84797 g.84797  ORF g.84797 m.84797 type:complete len:65 (+) comp8719_c5_seq1:386-580(+)